MEKFPDKMTGNDLVVQETYESNIERNIMDSMDRVDRRDRQGRIVSSTVTQKFRDGYDLINWYG